VDTTGCGAVEMRRWVRGGLIGGGYNYLFLEGADFYGYGTQLRITTALPPP
jgi:hypothetical protein